MTRFVVLILILATWPTGLRAERFVIDDDAYSDQVVRASEKLLREHKLVSQQSLQTQVQTKGFALTPASLSHEKLEPPELCERLRESTLAVGTFYKCPDCGKWHFSSSAGFVVNENGIVSTCCHVLLAQDEGVQESYLIAADASGHVFPVQAVLAADTDADTCLVRVNATGLKALPLRTGVRQGEPVYCLSHPGGYFFMFTQGMVARVNRRASPDTDEHGNSNRPQTRPVLLLNITAEFAPGSSGAPVVDPYGNVVGQVASIADAGEPGSDDENQANSPSVAIRFCTASEEILRLTNPNLARESHSPSLKPVKKPKQKVRQLSQEPVCPAKGQD